MENLPKKFLENLTYLDNLFFFRKFDGNLCENYVSRRNCADFFF